MGKGDNLNTARKIYICLVAYIITMAVLLISRLLNFYEILAFIVTSVLLGAFSLIMMRGKKREESQLKERKKRMYSALFFTAWLLAAIPFILLGDYFAQKSSMGWDVGFLTQGMGNALVWVGAVAAPISYQLFFNELLLDLLQDSLGKKIGAFATSLCFALYFADIRLFLALIALDLVLISIGKISKINGYLFSCLSSVLIVLILMVISGEYAGGVSFGLGNIIGMLLIFLTISFVIIYMMGRDHSKKEVSYVETLAVSLISLLVLLIGCLIVTL